MHVGSAAGQLAGGLTVRGHGGNRLIVAERGRRLPQRWQTAAAGRARGYEVLGAAGRTEPAAASPACAGVSGAEGLRRGSAFCPAGGRLLRGVCV